MRVLLKILAASIVLLLTLFVRICSATLYCSSLLFGLASTVVGLLGIAVLLTYSVQNGIILLILAFLISSIDLPVSAVLLLGNMQHL